jgi:hypothetical protein
MRGATPLQRLNLLRVEVAISPRAQRRDQPRPHHRTGPWKRIHQFIVGMGQRDLGDLSVISGDTGVNSLELIH